MNRFLLAGFVLLFVIGSVLLQSSTTASSGYTSNELIVPAAIVRDASNATKTMVINPRPFKEDSKVLFHVEHVKASGTDAATLTIEGSNFSPDLGLWDVVSTLSYSATADTTITLTNTHAYYKVVVTSTPSGAFSATTNVAVKLCK